MHATAFIVGPPDGPGAALSDMARALGFAAVLPYDGVALAQSQAQVTPICFFLFATVADTESLRDVAEAIRFDPSREVRFSPMIYFSENPAAETISACIRLGFDDIITLPATPRRVAERLERQVGANLTYYETPGYFGPDRRDRRTAEEQADAGRPSSQFRRLDIVRSFSQGAIVLRDDNYALI